LKNIDYKFTEIENSLRSCTISFYAIADQMHWKNEKLFRKFDVENIEKMAFFSFVSLFI
jgi:hypothetical protein